MLFFFCPVLKTWPNFLNNICILFLSFKRWQILSFYDQFSSRLKEGSFLSSGAFWMKHFPSFNSVSCQKQAEYYQSNRYILYAEEFTSFRLRASTSTHKTRNEDKFGSFFHVESQLHSKVCQKHAHQYPSKINLIKKVSLFS